MLTLSLDCGAAVLRVHLLGYHVIPVLLFGPRPRARSDSDGRHRPLGSLYILGSLVRTLGTHGLYIGLMLILIGSSVSATQKSKTCVILARCSSGVRIGHGISPPSCSC